MTVHLILPKHPDVLSSVPFSTQSPPLEELNPFGTEVISKFDSIIALIQDLEAQFLQTRQEVLRKSTIENREGGKICAIKARVIVSKKKYYRNLEGDIQTLSKTFQDHVNKIMTEFKSLKTVSGFEGNQEGENRSSSDFANNLILTNLNYELNPQKLLETNSSIKTMALPYIKKIDSAKKSGTPVLSRTPLKPLSKINFINSVEPAKKLEFDKIECPSNPPLCNNKENFHFQPKVQSLPCLPEIPETEETCHGVAQIRLGLLQEITNTEHYQTPKVIRSIKSHGFKLNPSETATSKPKLNDPSNF